MMNQPCRDCKNRYIGCHGECIKYKEWKEEYNKIKRTEWMSKYNWKRGYYHG